MNKFIEEATTNLKDLNDLIKDCSSKFILTMKFFRFKPKDGRVETAQPKDFFCTWLPFCQVNIFLEVLSLEGKIEKVLYSCH